MNCKKASLGLKTVNFSGYGTIIDKSTHKEQEDSVKECRGQPINGTLEQAVINGNF